MFFIRDLCALGHHITLPAERTWKPRLREYLGAEIDSGKIKVVYTPRLIKPIWNGLWAGLRLRGKWDIGFVGNSTKGIVPVVDFMLWRGLFKKVVIQASKQPPPNFAAACDRWPCVITTLSAFVSSGFLAHQRERAMVYYGVVGAEMYTPGARQLKGAGGEHGRCGEDELVHFGLVGLLDNPWKGGPMALEAMGKLPADVAPRVRLHMMSYLDKPECSDERVVFHVWRRPGEIPDMLRRMDALLVPSSAGETFSQAMVQGMLTALPVITSNLPVLTEKLDAGGGLVAANSDEMAAKMAELARDAGARRAMGERGREVALARYVWNTADFVERFMRGKGAEEMVKVRNSQTVR